MAEIFTAEALVALVALTAMEIVLGIDNIVFIAILTGKLPEGQQPQARFWGLALAMVMRVLLLLSLSWILRLTDPIFSLAQLGPVYDWAARVMGVIPEEVSEISVRDIILFVGGLFLIAKSVHEIHVKLEGSEEERKAGATVSFGSVLFQIALLDIIFSLDSVITAVGMAKDIWVMVTAVILAILVMMVFAGRISDFVSRHPTVKMLALSFLILIGVMLVAEGVGTHVNKGYIYFAMAFSLVVEMLNLKLRVKKMPTVPASEL
jgi:predicted tellurium resistance membrane protein TerC